MPHYGTNFKESLLFSYFLLFFAYLLEKKMEYFLTIGDSIFTMRFLVWPLTVHGNRYSTPGQSGDERRG